LQNYILIFMVAIYPLVVVPGPLDYFRGPRYIILAIASLIAAYLLFKDRISLKHPAFIPLGLFLFLALLSTLGADNPHMAWMGSNMRFTGLSTYLFGVILFLLAYYHGKPRQIIVSMILGAVAVSIIGVLQYYGINFIPHPVYSPASIRAYATMGNVNWFGCYTAFVLIASLLLYLKEKNWLWLLTTGIIYAGMLVSLTRGAWLAFFASFVIILYIFYRNRDLKKHFAFLLIIFVVVTMTLLSTNEWSLFERASSVPEAVSSSVSMVDDSVEASGSVFERIYIWENAFKDFKDNWALGIGADHFRLVMPSGRVEDKAHNIYLEIALAMGIFALAAFLAFIAFVVRKQGSKTGFIFLMLVITYLFQGFVNNDVIQIMPLFWIVLGLTLASNSLGYQFEVKQGKIATSVESESKDNRKISLPDVIMIIAIASFILMILFWFFYPSHGTVQITGSGEYTGQLRGSTYHGEGTWVSDYGAVYEGEFKHGQFDGFGVLSFPDGSEYVGEFKRGHFHGEGKLITPDGEVIEGEWKMGNRID